jgi:predicted dehydrogenase
MPSKPLGAAVVGTGFGVLTHLRALRRAGFEVRALVGRDPERTAERAQRFDVPNGLTSLDDALALPGVDVVAVATPPHTHADIVLRALDAGKHVLCEKPFARNAEEGRAMLARAEATGLVHMLGTEFRWATGQAVATRAIREGLIGEPKLATFLFHMPALADPAAETPAWWGRAEEGGGWLGAYASHVIDQVRQTCGEFAGVSASLSLLSDRDWTAEDSYTVHFRTVAGVDGMLQSSSGAWGPFAMCSRISGSAGTVTIEGDSVSLTGPTGSRVLDIPEDLRLPPPEPPPSELLVTAYDGLHSMGIDLAPYTKLFLAMADRIAGASRRGAAADPEPATFADGVAIQQVLDAIRQSSAEQRWVEIA